MCPPVTKISLEDFLLAHQSCSVSVVLCGLGNPPFLYHTELLPNGHS